MKHILGKIIYCLGLGLVGMVICEIGLRGLYHFVPIHTTAAWQEDPIFGRTMKPSQRGLFVTQSHEYATFIETNSLGFRDIEHEVVNKNNAYRILFVGDSFVGNFQVLLEKTFFRQLEKKLSAETNRPIEVIAMGLGDSGTGQQTLILKKGLEYHPDLVVEVFYEGNDVKNNSLLLQGDPYRPYYVISQGELKLVPFKLPSANKIYQIKQWLKERSRLVELILDAKGKLLGKNSEIPIDYGVFEKNYTEAYQQAWEVTLKLLSMQKLMAKEIGADYVVVGIPSREQVSLNLWQETQNVYPKMKTYDYDLERPKNILDDWCTQTGTSCWFANDEFRLDSEKTYFKYDGHWTQEGTDLFALFLDKKIFQNKRI